MRNIATLFAFLLLALTVPAGATIYNTEAPLTGSTDLLGFGNWAGNASISWDITQVGTNVWNYEYEFVHDGSDLSHLVLEFSLSCEGDDECITNATNDPDGPRWYNAFSPPNFEMPVSVFGTKFNFSGGSPYVFSFTSNRNPVWGDLYARDGGNAYAYNAGMLNHASNSAADFVARPNGEPHTDPVPDPQTFVLLGSGLLTIAWRQRRSSKLIVE